MRERAELLGGTLDAAPTAAGSGSSCGCRRDGRSGSLVADDQRVVREGLAMLLGLLPGIEVVGAAATATRRSRSPRACSPTSC